MKLVSGGGGKRAKKASNKETSSKVKSAKAATKAKKDTVKISKAPTKKTTRKKVVIAVCSILVALVLVGVSAFAIVLWEVQPFYDIFFPRPDLSARNPIDPIELDDPDSPYYSGGVNTDVARPLDVNNPEFSDVPLEDIRNTSKITFLILGIDGYKGLRLEGGGNTDVIMVASFDMDESTLDIVSIPRDTIANVPWSVKKVNSIWANMSNKYKGETDATNLTMADTRQHFSNFIGFSIDYWVTIDMAAFESLVNALGGVTVNVPSSFRLVEKEMGMDVRLSAGVQTLNGQQALALARYRGYGDGDFGRVHAQQLIMKALAEQLLSASAIRNNPVDFANTLLKYVKTNMDVNEIVRVGREGLNVPSENISFATAPVSPYTVTGSGAGWYATVELDGWLELVNDKLNPFHTKITANHVSILTLDENNKLYVTDGNWQGSQSWGRR